MDVITNGPGSSGSPVGPILKWRRSHLFHCSVMLGLAAAGAWPLLTGIAQSEPAIALFSLWVCGMGLSGLWWLTKRFRAPGIVYVRGDQLIVAGFFRDQALPMTELVRLDIETTPPPKRPWYERSSPNNYPTERTPDLVIRARGPRKVSVRLNFYPIEEISEFCAEVAAVVRTLHR